MPDIELVSADGSVRASINPVAASIRTLAVRGRALVEPYEGDQPPGAAGAVLVPWPNRVRDGRWLLDGAVQQLAITDPATHSANHGLLATTRYRVGERTADSVTLHARLDSPPGYPFTLATSVRYRLRPAGIDARHVLVNESSRSAPVALGVHPYLRAGEAPDLVDELVDDLTRLERELAAVPATNSFEGTKTVRIYNLLAHGPLYEQVPVHPAVLPIVECVLDPGCLISSLSSDCSPASSTCSLVAYLATYSARTQSAYASNGAILPASFEPAIPLTFDLDIVCLGLFHQQRRRLAVQWIRRVGVSQQLRQEDLKDVDHVVHR